MVHHDENAVASTNTGILSGLINKVTTGGTKSGGENISYGAGGTPSSTNTYGSSSPTTSGTTTGAYGSGTVASTTGTYGSSTPTTSTGSYGAATVTNGAYGSSTPTTGGTTASVYYGSSTPATTGTSAYGTNAYGSSTPTSGTSTSTGAYGSDTITGGTHTSGADTKGYDNNEGGLHGFISSLVRKRDEGKDDDKPMLSTGYGSKTTTGGTGTYTSGVDTTKGYGKLEKDSTPNGYDTPTTDTYKAGTDTKGYDNGEDRLRGFISGLVSKRDEGKVYDKPTVSTGYGSETIAGGNKAYTSNTGTGAYTSGIDIVKGYDKSDQDTTAKNYKSNTTTGGTYPSGTNTKGYGNDDGGIHGLNSGPSHKGDNGYDKSNEDIDDAYKLDKDKPEKDLIKGYGKPEKEPIKGYDKPEKETPKSYDKDSKTSGYSTTTTSGAYGTGATAAATNSYGTGTGLSKGTKGYEQPEKESVGAYNTNTGPATGAYTTSNSNGYTVTSPYAKMLAATNGLSHNEVARQVVTNDVISDPEAHTEVVAMAEKRRHLEGNEDHPRHIRWLQAESTHDLHALRGSNMSLVGTNANNLQFLAGGATLLVAGVVLGVAKRLKNRSNNSKLKAQEQDIYSLME